jgi:tetratricopeptide (TPR) repeat protein
VLVSDLDEMEVFHIENHQVVQGQVIGSSNTIHQYFGASHPLAFPVHTTPPAASRRLWNIPFPRNPFFTGQERLLEQLHTQFQAMQIPAQGHPLAISGLGGIGKTQLALEYAYRYRQEYQAVFWAQAETEDALTTSYTEIAHALQLPQSHAGEQGVMIQAAKDWLANADGWLLILDNADDLSFIPTFLPTIFSGHLLLTTRTQITGALARRLEIETLEKEAGALLLLRRAGQVAPGASLASASPEDVRIACQLAEEFEGLPLVLDQAGAYIEETQCRLPDYWQHYQRQRTRMLARRGGVTSAHPDPVTTTWSLSFARVEQASPIAAELLHICAFLAPDAIPEELLVEVCKRAHPAQQGMTRARRGRFARLLGGSPPQQSHAPLEENEGKIDEAIAILRAYSFLQRNTQEKSVRVHRLVQMVIRDTLEEPAQKAWITRVIHAVHALFPSGHALFPGNDLDVWEQCARYLPQALECGRWITDRDLPLVEGVALLNNVSLYLRNRGQYSQAERIIKRAISLSEQYWGVQPDGVKHTLVNLGEPYKDSLTMLADIYDLQRRYDEAKLVVQRLRGMSGLQSEAQDTQLLITMAHLSQKQGKESEAEQLLKHALSKSEQQADAQPTTATILASLGSLYNSQKRYAEAEPLYQRALAIGEQFWGGDHLSTSTCLNNLATTYLCQGKYAEAEPLLQRALSIREQRLGTIHPFVVVSLLNLAALFIVQQRYAEAESQFARVFSVQEALGEDGRVTADELDTLADLYKTQGKDPNADPLYQRALSLSQRELRADNPKTASDLNDLAQHYEEQGNKAQAEALFRQALTMSEQELGSTHPLTASILMNLASLFYSEEKYAEAEPLFQRALAIREQIQETDHSALAVSLWWLAVLYEDTQRPREAIVLYERALPMYERAFGPDHPTTRDIREGYANLLVSQAHHAFQQGRYAEAEPLYQRILHLREQQLEPGHSDLTVSLSNLAECYREQDKYAEAEPLFRQALDIRERHMEPDHSDVATSCNNLALLYEQQGRYAEAEPLYQRALRIWTERAEADSLNIFGPLNNLANLYREQGRYREAEPLYQHALQIIEQKKGSDDLEVTYPLHGLAELSSRQGRWREALSLYQRELRIIEQHQGPNHPEVAYPLTGLANLARDQGQYVEATRFYQRALYLRERRLHPEHLSVATTLNGLAELSRLQGDYAGAARLFQRALRIREQRLGPQHPDVAVILSGLASLARDQGDVEQAKLLLQRTLAIHIRVYGADHPLTQQVRERSHELG